MLPFTRIRPGNLPNSKFLFNADVRFRNDASGSVNIPAVLNTDYQFILANQTSIKFLKFNTYYSTICQPILGRNLYLRFRLTGLLNLANLQPQNNGNLFIYSFLTNIWYELKVQYAATPNGTHKWFVNNVQQYSGTKYAAPYFFFGLGLLGPNTLEFDVGGAGGTLPSGYRWWYNPRSGS